MPASDNRYEREGREHDLAVWMIAQDARTHTITRWTNLGRHRVQALSRCYQNTAPGDHRRRGVSPFQAAYFAKSLKLEAESLAFAFFAYELQVIPYAVQSDARHSLPGLGRGERLRVAYDLYRRLVTGAHISLERAIVLVIELAERRNLSLRRCRICKDVMIIDRLGPPHDRCPFCRSDRQPRHAPDTID